MCGFYGIIDFEGEISAQDKIDVSQGADLAKYRGPDDSRMFSNKFICIKFNRLSIIDLSAECQPFISENENTILVCNGEIYNFIQLKKQLIQKNYNFKSNNDIEVLLHGYEEWGEQLFNKIQGMFSLVIWDKLKRKAFMVRDHIGIKPLHYKIFNKKIYFSTDYNSFKRSNNFDREIDYDSLLSYFSFRYAIGEKTYYKGIYDVLPGNYIECDGNSLNKKVYWDLKPADKYENFSERWYIEKLDEKLSNAVESHLMSDVPLGAFISGGLDSSLILYYMKRFKNDIRTFSTGFEDEGYNELEYINLINQELKTNLTYFQMTETEFLENMQKTLSYRGEPVSIPHETAFLQMSEMMKSDISVVMSGEGADEIFGGYGRIFRSPHDFYKNNFFLINKEQPMNHFISKYAWFSEEDKKNMLNLEFFNNKLFDDYSIEYLDSIFNKHKNISYYEKMFYVMPKIHLPNMLNRLDRMTMAASVEARVPFLDKKLIEFAFSIPQKYKIAWKNKFSKYKSIFLNSSNISEKHDIPKYILKKVAEGKLNPKIINRKKVAFPLPMNRWLETSIKDLARNMLLENDAKISNIIDKKFLSKFLDNDSFKAGEDLDGKRIWMLINLEMWLQENS